MANTRFKNFHPLHAISVKSIIALDSSQSLAVFHWRSVIGLFSCAVYQRIVCCLLDGVCMCAKSCFHNFISFSSASVGILFSVWNNSHSCLALTFHTIVSTLLIVGPSRKILHEIIRHVHLLIVYHPIDILESFTYCCFRSISTAPNELSLSDATL